MMGEKLKFPIPVLIILIVMSLSLAGATFYLFQKERAKNLSLQEELGNTRTKQRVAEAKFKDSQNSMAQLASELGEVKAQIDALTADLQQERTAKEEALSKVEQLKADLAQREGLKSDLEKKFSEAQKEIQNLQAQAKELGSQKADLETKLKDLEAKSQSYGIELGKIVVSPELASQDSGHAPTTSPEGKVLVINKDYNFAVINLGSKNGIAMDNLFSVYHDNSYLGDIKIEKLYDSMSAAGFVSGDLKDKISEGDRVILKNK